MNKVNHLIHPKIIERYASSQALDSHKQAILQSWAESIKSGTLQRQAETNLDGAFIDKILCQVLGYSQSVDSNLTSWSLVKNQSVGRGNVDVALGTFSDDMPPQIIAPFELKGAKTKDLDSVMSGRGKSPVHQAWEYAMDAKGAKWVLVSNYLEIRLYAVGYGRKDYEIFDLSKLHLPKEFQRFILLLSAENLLGTKSESLLKENEQRDKEITDSLYSDYKNLRKRLIEALGESNPNYDLDAIISYSQTILDRILFIAFAEDKDLLPDNTLKQAFETQNQFNPQPVWLNFLGLFQAIDKGNSQLKIPHYNGGLFHKDTLPADITLTDNICELFKKIGDYDFSSDINVNILGHIFEQSISDIEELKNDNFDVKKGKRKKDGVFYTPPYITSYIVEQSVGGWLRDKKQALGFDKLPELTEADYNSKKVVTKGKNKGKISYNKKITDHIQAWEAYKTALSSIKVIDPACGSGAFLNEVFDCLNSQGQEVNNTLSNLQGGQCDLFRWDTHILANNIYGVDINIESVEITKLSLWLKTANRGEKLTYLENNIKCGNSLIDDPAIAGDKAFKWEQEFSEIMDNGGFDVVVGNPPYFNIQTLGLNSSIANHLKDTSKIWADKSDILFYFIEKAIYLSKSRVGFIASNAFLKSSKAIKLRNYILDNAPISKIIDFEKYMVFEDASITSTVFELDKNKKNNKVQAVVFKDSNYTKDYIAETITNEENYFNVSLQKNKVFALVSENIALLNSKIDSNHQQLSSVVKIGKGMETAANKVFSFKELPSHLPKEFIRKRMSGEIIQKYAIQKEIEYILYIEGVERFEDLPLEIQKHLNENKDFLENRATVRNEGRIWWRYSRPMHKGFYSLNKIWCSYRAKENIFCFDNTQEYIGYTNTTVIFDTNKKIGLRYILTLLNSKLLTFRYRSIGKQTGSGVFEYFENGVAKLPIPKATAKEQAPFIAKAEIMLTKNKELQELSDGFINLLQADLSLAKVTKKLAKWYELSDAEFLNELKKQKITLIPAQKREILKDFGEQKSQAQALQSTITTTDKQIDAMVYALYNLTEAEIKIVEGE